MRYGTYQLYADGHGIRGGYYVAQDGTPSEDGFAGSGNFTLEQAADVARTTPDAFIFPDSSDWWYVVVIPRVE